MENEVMELNRHHSTLTVSAPSTTSIIEPLPQITLEESITTKTLASIIDVLPKVTDRPPVSNGDFNKANKITETTCNINQHHKSESSSTNLSLNNSQEFDSHSLPTPPPPPPPFEIVKDLSLPMTVPPIDNRDTGVVSPQSVLTPQHQQQPQHLPEHQTLQENTTTEVSKSQIENDANHTRISIKRKATDDDKLLYGMHRDKIFKNNKKKYNPFNLMPDADLPQDLFNDSTDVQNNQHHLPSTLMPSTLQLPPPLPPMLFNTPLQQQQHQQQHSMNGGFNDEIRNFLRDQIKFWGGGRLNEVGGFLTNEYAQYLGLQPAVKFKCFKCGDAQFSSLYELKEHQVMCLKRVNVVPPNPSEFLTSTTILTPPPIATQQKSSTASSNQKPNDSSQSGSIHDPSTKIRITRKVFLCSACGTYYENWNLFLHMREVHKRHICLYCLGLFPSSDRLLSHLMHKHNIAEQKFDSREHLMQTMKSPCYLMCSNCEHVFNEIDNFSNHLCENYMEPCVECGLKSVHKPNCSIGIAAKAVTAKSKKERDKMVTFKKKNVPNGFADVNGISPPSTSSLNTYRDYSNNTAMDLSQHNGNICVAPPAPPQTASPAKTLPSQNHLAPNATITSNHVYSPALHQPEIPENINETNPESVTSDKNIENSNQLDTSFENNNDEDDDSSSSSDESQSSETSSSSASEKDESRGFAQIVSTGEIPPEASQSQPGTPLLVPKLKIKFNQKTFQSSFETPPPLPSDNDDDETESDDDDDDDNVDDHENNEVENAEVEEDEQEDEEEPEEDSNDNVNKQESNKEENMEYIEDCGATEINANGGEHSNNDLKKNSDREFQVNVVDAIDEKIDEMEPRVLDDKISEPNMEIKNQQVDVTNNTECNIENKLPDTVAEDPLDDDCQTQLSVLSETDNIKSAMKLKLETSDNDENKNLLNESPIKSEMKDVDTTEMNMNIDEELSGTNTTQISNFNKSTKIETPKSELKDKTKEEIMDTTDNKYINEIDLIKSIEEPNILDITPNNDIQLATEDSLSFELTLQHPLDKIDIRDFLKICLKAAVPFCSYCNHARRIAVNGNSLASHLISQHRFSAIVDSITAEELLPSTLVSKIKSCLNELESVNLNLESYDSFDKTIGPETEKIFECFQCRFVTNIHKELYLHNRKMHLKSILLCIMCKSNFYSYSELICHMCPGVYNKVAIIDLTFRCCICNLDNIPSAFRLMVHIRKKHNACDVCLEECFDQSRLSNHVWKHKLHHLCYRCGIAYRNKPDITKHLFWKHGTESASCKRCLQKKWPHVYHFCIPPPLFVCEVCDLDFGRAVSLKVHKRLHNDEAKYPCTEDDCEKKFISRKLLLKHVERHSMVIEEIPDMDDDMNIKSEINDEENEEESEIAKIEKDEKDGNLKVENVSSKDCEEKKVKEKSKKRKSSKNDKKGSQSIITDIIDLPAVNLSESDSSDDDEPNQAGPSLVSEVVTNTEMMNMDIDNELVEDENKPASIDIWNNFKQFQEKQKKSLPNVGEEREEAIPPPILHVVQSDHDYAMMYRPIKLIDDKKSNLDNKLNATPKKSSSKSPKKKSAKISDSSSSSDSSSGSDSCSCGPDCSCSSSSSDSSSTSSDDEATVGTPNEKRKKSSKKNDKKRTESETAEQKSQNDTIDVVNSDPKISSPSVDPDSIILESDLETDESETDEDFYDEHPQKMASQLLAEKRNQLMLRTSMNPMNNAVVENSRPSTPSLPEEAVKEKRVKLKKKKRKKDSGSPYKSSPIKSDSSFKLESPLKMNSVYKPELYKSLSIKSDSPGSPFKLSIIPPVRTEINSPKIKDDLFVIQPPTNLPEFVMSPAPSLFRNNFQPFTPNDQIMSVSTPLSSSTPNSSSSSKILSDNAIKRSKRRRRPNRFYGYSSDEDHNAPMQQNSMNSSLFRPTAPPILTWNKEDLPSPSPQPAHKLKIKSPSLPKSQKLQKQSSRNSSRTTSPINYPPISQQIIRPPYQEPPKVEPLRVPAVPVHHITPIISDDAVESSDSDNSESSTEGNLQISTPSVRHPLKTKIVRNKSMTSAPQIKSRSKSKKSNIQYNPTHPIVSSQQHRLQNKPRIPPIIHNSALPAQLFQPPSNHTTSYGHSSNLPANDQLSSTQSQPFVRPPPQINPITGQLCYPPAGTRVPVEGESVYCYCQCPYDEVSEMIACDGDDCRIEWFHFECVGIMVPPKGKWYCPDCKPKYPMIDAFDDDDDDDDPNV